MFSFSKTLLLSVATLILAVGPLNYLINSAVALETSPSVFTRNLQLGMVGEDVKELQKYLNNYGFLVSEIGAGSRGNETTFFGVRTKQALIKFQEQNADTILKPLGLKSGTGNFYEFTRNFINATNLSSTTQPSIKNISGSTIPAGYVQTTAGLIKERNSGSHVSSRVLSYVAGPNGTIVGITSQSVSSGESGTMVTATPSTNYHFVSWSDGLTNAVRTDTNVSVDISVIATFAINTLNTFAITSSAGVGGSITPNGNVAVDYGTDKAFTITWAANYNLADLPIDSLSMFDDNYPLLPIYDCNYDYWSEHTVICTFSNVSADHTISATFTEVPVYVYTSVGVGGSITPNDDSGRVIVDYGTDKTFTITPDAGYIVTDVVVSSSGGDLVSVGAVTSYTFTNVREIHTIQVYFSHI